MIPLAALCGCFRGPADGKVQVAGVVTYEGKPLQHGGVLFTPTSPGDGGSAVIRTGGTFSVRLLPGEYLIAVRCYEESEATTSEHVLYTPARSVIPEKYTDAGTSTLRITASVGMAPVELSLVK